MVHSGQLPVEEDEAENKSSTQKSVCINNNQHWWPLVLHHQRVQCLLFVWKEYPNVCITPYPHTHTHPTHSTPPWACSASWMTVSMWQSSLKWKGSRMLGYCASFTKLGFHPFGSACQRLGLWVKAFENNASAVLKMQPKMVWHLSEKNPSCLIGHMRQKANAEGHSTAIFSSSRREEKGDHQSFYYYDDFPCAGDDVIQLSNVRFA